MAWKKIGLALLFPHIVFMLLLIPASIAFLLCSVLMCGSESPITIVSYVLSAYTLTVWSFKIPYLIRFFRAFKEENPLVRRWREDTRLRIHVSLYGTLIWNVAYASLNLGMGIWHRTFWFLSLAGYYAALAVMRFFLLRHARKHVPGEKMLAELKKYRACGVVFLVMNLALALIVFFMVYWNRTFRHHEITTITLAAYTFTAFTMSIINVVRYRRYNSPVYSAAKVISLASACVSMLTLEATMLTTFGNGTVDLAFRRLMLGLSGGVISAFIIFMAVLMIVQSTKRIKLLRQTEESNHGASK